MRKPAWLAKARVEMVLDMSTAHISEDDVMNLERPHKYVVNLRCIDNPIISYKYAEGFFVVVPPTTPKGKALPADTRRALAEYGYSKDFIEIMAICVNQNMRFLRLDADGEKYNSLPTFDW